MPFAPTHSSVNNEGCSLHYWYHGTGPLLFLTPGGNGDGRQFNPLMAALSHRFTVATFDRRSYAGSRNGEPHRLNPPQQTRDMLAVINALGFDKAIVFGSSLGGTLALQFAITYPQYVHHLIAHEAPAMTLLPDQSALETTLGLVDLAETQGYRAAADKFSLQLAEYGYNDEGVPRTGGQEEPDVEFFWKYEILISATYLPNLPRLRENGTSVALMAGLRSKDAFYARSTYEQQKVLGCLRVDVPGHHQGFEVETDAFVPAFLDVLGKLEAKQTIG